MSTNYFLDSSALVKRYTIETGSTWVDAIAHAESGNAISIALITISEVAAALASKLRRQEVTAEQFELAIKNLLQDSAETFTLITVDQNVIQRSIDVIRRNFLRGYDAVQLASGLVLNESLIPAGEQPVTFVTADKTLLAAAHNEGLLTDDPNDH